MKQTPLFVTLSAGLAVIGTALVAFALQLQAEGYEQYVQDVGYLAGTAYFTAIMTLVTWVRARRLD
ncbi:SCO3870 family protein [Streptomyces sp. NPDC086787]|uniref:SCO3870 family protein n=1 Tax=Streptomyces sp. NPDC086787 TaxID=3365759 RepID=UPI003830D7B8